MQPQLFDIVDDERRARGAASWSAPDLDTVAAAIRATPDPIIDCETTGLCWWDRDRVVGWAVSTDAGDYYLPTGHRGGGNLPEGPVLEMLNREVRGKHVDNVNTKFDIHIGRESGVDLAADDRENTFGDVAHHAALLDDQRRRFNLELLGHDFLGLEQSKVKLDISSGALIADLPAGEVAPYAIRDVRLVRQIREVTRRRLVEEDLLRVLALEEQVLPAVVEMERNGAFIDMELLTTWLAASKQEFEAVLWKVYRETGVKFSSPDSAKDLLKLFQTLRIPITHFTDAGAPSFTDEVMRQHTATHPIIGDVRYAGQLADLNSKYLVKYHNTVRADGWIRFNLHQLRYSRDDGQAGGTGPGRFSSAGDEFGGFNVQQVVSVDKQLERDWCPKYPVRQLFRPQQGSWLAADAKQIEYRLFAHYAASPRILAVYAQDPDADYHAVVRTLLETLRPNFGRKRTKNCNFAKIFGAGKDKFAAMLADIDVKHITDEHRSDAAGVNAAYDHMFPEVKPLLRAASRAAEQRGHVHTILGRRSRFTVDKRFHKALNNIIQGSAADYNKLVIVELHKRRKELSLTPRFTVHDEWDGDAHDPSKLDTIRQVFNRQYIPSLKVPILWDVKLGRTWKDAK